MIRENEHLVDTYLHSLKTTNHSPRTIENYHCDLKKFINWYEKTQTLNLARANTKTIENYQHYLMTGDILYKKAGFFEKIALIFIQILKFRMGRKKYGVLKAGILPNNALAIGSRKRHLSAIKNFFTFLQEIHADKGGKFKVNPVKSKIHVIKLKDADIEHTKMLGAEDWMKLKEACWRTQERLTVNLLYFGGLRLSEITHLKFSDFNEHKRSVTFIRKGGSRHELFLQNFELIYKDVQFMQRKAPSEYLFANKNGLPVTSRTMSNRIMSLLKKANTSDGLSPHSFRKACATNLYRKTKDLLLVRDYLNHSDAKVTQTYIDKALFQREMFLLGTSEKPS
ncbi:site-specific recombinase, phage integrase family [Bacteriovorax sp. BSW11_IV]|uniref:tyrosine-type recombinase/integrase n=1 Tax=Bacteriovorax sp. BSW11_IV TaxID=1353529 RepID=UPI00038A5009|nr:tyrosine-type recombinase/integrase [Bacteriovorax sp. BSW11_IV]EQC49489.1 site-specific recombinase, phage integrase family [Bacteriovorax sp. BSW11_IV]